MRRRAHSEGRLGKARCLLSHQRQRTGGGGGEVGLALHRAKLRQLSVDEPGVEIPFAKTRRVREREEERGVGAWPRHHRLPERSCQPVERLGPVAAMRDHLGDHGIVERR